MIDKLVLKAHLRDFYLKPALYLDEYKVQGRGCYRIYPEQLAAESDFFELSAEDYQQFAFENAENPKFIALCQSGRVCFVPQHFSMLELGMNLSGGIKPRRRVNGDFDHEHYDVEELRKHWESVESSYAGLAFNIYDHRGDSAFAVKLHCPIYIEFHASPAKLVQGHNVFGSDDIVYCKDVMLDVLLSAYPVLSKFFDFDNLKISAHDLTYFSRAKTQEEAELFNFALKDVGKGQTKSRSSHYGTVYFGAANSKLKKIKVYCKWLEVMGFYNDTLKGIQNAIKRVAKLDCDASTIDIHNAVIPIHKIKDYNLLKIYTQELLDFCLGMIRWEVTIKSDWLRARGYSLDFNIYKDQFNAQKLWKEAHKDIFALLESKHMIIADYSEKHIEDQLREHFVTYDKHGKPRYTNATNAFKTFLLIKARGYWQAAEYFKTQRCGNKFNQTWYRHLEMFRTIGLTDIYLQNFKDGNDSTATVVPLLIFSTVDFNNQFPPFYQQVA